MRTPTRSHNQFPYILFYIFLLLPPCVAGEQVDRPNLDELQRAALRYIWEDGDPETGLAYEASFAYPEYGRPLAVGGTGFGVAAIVAGVERGWLDRGEAAERVKRICSFLRDHSPRKELHGAFPHWIHEDTGRALRFSELDDGADLVETALLMQGLLIARAYFDGDGAEADLRACITDLWEGVEWDWFADRHGDGLYWHWSPNHEFAIGMKIQGFNESLITYILALSSPTHPITAETYRYWAAGAGYRRHSVFGYEVDASLPGAGPAFLTHYSFIGLNPWQMADEFVPGGYYVRNVRHILGNRGYCLYEAPPENRYSPGFWSLTASLIPGGYAANDPAHDSGTVAPTAALASMPYTPHYSMQVLESLLGRHLFLAWGSCGPFDAINIREKWVAREYLAIDQLPIVCMVENYRSGLFWNLFMAIPEVQKGLATAGIHPPKLKEGFPEVVLPLIWDGEEYVAEAYDLRLHPDKGLYRIPYWRNKDGLVRFTLRFASGGAVWTRTDAASAGRNWLEFSPVTCRKGEYMHLYMRCGDKEYRLPIRLH
ncbi:MAG: hypothetical protein LUE17_05035 [Planctomycetaceae bacterium]|nr:hypothetical protein [Planctomycetaceae bacterium]